MKVVEETLEDPMPLEKRRRLPACLLVEQRALEVCRGRRGACLLLKKSHGEDPPTHGEYL